MPDFQYNIPQDFCDFHLRKVSETESLQLKYYETSLQNDSVLSQDLSVQIIIPTRIVVCGYKDRPSGNFFFNVSEARLDSIVMELNEKFSSFNIVFIPTYETLNLDSFKVIREGVTYDYINYPITYYDKDINNNTIPGIDAESLKTNFSENPNAIFNIFLVKDIAGLDYDGTQPSSNHYSAPMISMNPAAAMIDGNAFGLIVSMWNFPDLDIYYTQAGIDVNTYASTYTPSENNTHEFYRGIGHSLGLLNIPTPSVSLIEGNSFYNYDLNTCPPGKCLLTSVAGDCCVDTHEFTLNEALYFEGLIEEASCIRNNPLVTIDNIMSFVKYDSNVFTVTSAQIERVRANFDSTWMYQGNPFILTQIGQYTLPDQGPLDPIINVPDLNCDVNGPTLNTHDIENFVQEIQNEIQQLGEGVYGEQEALLQGQILYLANLLYDLPTVSIQSNNN